MCDQLVEEAELYEFKPRPYQVIFHLCLFESKPNIK